jgi:hypothetical protein
MLKVYPTQILCTSKACQKDNVKHYRDNGAYKIGYTFYPRTDKVFNCPKCKSYKHLHVRNTPLLSMLEELLEGLDNSPELDFSLITVIEFIRKENLDKHTLSRIREKVKKAKKWREEEMEKTKCLEE